jgi:hypothetical protein
MAAGWGVTAERVQHLPVMQNEEFHQLSAMMTKHTWWQSPGKQVRTFVIIDVGFDPADDVMHYRCVDLLEVGQSGINRLTIPQMMDYYKKGLMVPLNPSLSK